MEDLNKKPKLETPSEPKPVSSSTPVPKTNSNSSVEKAFGKVQNKFSKGFQQGPNQKGNSNDLVRDSNNPRRYINPSANPNVSDSNRETIMKQGFAPKGWKPGDQTSGYTKISELNFNNPYRKNPKVAFGIHRAIYPGLNSYNDDLSKLSNDVKAGKKISLVGGDDTDRIAYFLHKNGVLKEDEIPENYRKNLGNMDFSMKHDIPYDALGDIEDIDGNKRQGYGNMIRNFMGRGHKHLNPETGKFDIPFNWDEDLYQEALLDFNKSDPYKTKQLQHMYMLYPGLRKALKENKWKDVEDQNGKRRIRDWGAWGDNFDDYFDNFYFGLNDAYTNAYKRKYGKDPYEIKSETNPFPQSAIAKEPDLNLLKTQNFDRPEQVTAWLDKNYPGLDQQKKDAIIKQWWTW